MKLVVLFLALSGIGHNDSRYQDIKVASGDSGVFQAGNSIVPGTFVKDEYTLVVLPTPSASGSFTIGGFLSQGSTRRLITGTLTKQGTLKASVKRRAGQTQDTPIDGRYDFNTDVIVLTKVNGKPVQWLFEREGGKVKLGAYSGTSSVGTGNWELTISKSATKDYTVQGTIEFDGKKSPFKGTMKPNGKIAAAMTNNDLAKIDGQYDFQDLDIDLTLSMTGVFERITSKLKFGSLPAPALFGLVDKVVGNIPEPINSGDHRKSGSISESSVSSEVIMNPPYEGQASVKFQYSSQLSSTLKTGQIVELTVMASAEKSGTYQPNWGANGWWQVEGDGAEVLEMTKTFAGTASDGKFYGSSTGKTRFKVLRSGSIKVTAAYHGYGWGQGVYNWHPCTYTYKFKAAPTQHVGN